MSMDTVLSIMVLAAIALLAGAFLLWRKGGSAQHVGLMVILALVAIVNVAIWLVPDATGEAPLQRIDAPE